MDIVSATLDSATSPCRRTYLTPFAESTISCENRAKQRSMYETWVVFRCYANFVYIAYGKLVGVVI